MWGERKYKEVTLILPVDKFGKIPSKIDYHNVPYGRMEKAYRLLIRSMVSAIDNTENAEIYKELRRQYFDKGSLYNKLKYKQTNLRDQLTYLKRSAEQFQLKIEGCSAIKMTIEDIQKRMNKLKIEKDEIKKKIPKYMWDSLYWW
jgi:hypothetical protein